MKIFDKFGNEHKTVEDALAAEKAYDKKVAEEKARKEQLATKRAERAKEVENAFKEAAAAYKNYQEVLNAFIKDYGSYHCTISDGDINDNIINDPNWKLIDNVINTLFAL